MNDLTSGRTIPSNAIVWFAVLGGPLAWAAQFAVNLFVTWFNCGKSSAFRASVPSHTLQVAVGIAGLVVALLSSAVALWLFLATVSDRETSRKVRRGFGGDPPLARVHFLAVVGLTVNFLVIAIIVMTTVGVPALVPCQQS